MALVIGRPTNIQIDPRYVLLLRSHAVTDVYDALTELLTNADDSYNRLYRTGRLKEDGGQILIEH